MASFVSWGFLFWFLRFVSLCERLVIWGLGTHAAVHAEVRGRSLRLRYFLPLPNHPACPFSLKPGFRVAHAGLRLWNCRCVPLYLAVTQPVTVRHGFTQQGLWLEASCVASLFSPALKGCSAEVLNARSFCFCSASARPALCGLVSPCPVYPMLGWSS